jgi:iron(III) transport system permease protein
MVQLDASLEEASRILGGTWLHTLRRVTIPLIMPGFITSFLIAYILSFHEFSSSILLYTPGNDTVGVITWEMYRMGKWEMAAGITLIDVAITSCLFYIANKTSKRGLPVPTV